MNIVKSGFSCCHWLISVAFTNIKLRFLKHRAFKKGAAQGLFYDQSSPAERSSIANLFPVRRSDLCSSNPDVKVQRLLEQPLCPYPHGKNAAPTDILNQALPHSS